MEPPQGEHSHLSAGDHHPIVSHTVRKGYVASNGVASICELGLGIVTGNVALAADGLHGSAEIVIGNEQMKDAHEHAVVDGSRRKKISSALFGASLVGSAVAAGELLDYWNPGIHDPRIDALGMFAAGVACLSAGIASSSILRKVRTKYGRIMDGIHLNKVISPTERDVVNHVARLDLPSSALALGATSLGFVANTYAVKNGALPLLEDAQSSIGIGMGLWGAWLFRPTKKNLHHTHTYDSI